MKFFRRLVIAVLLLVVVAGGGLYLLTTNTAIGSDLRSVVSNQIQGAINSRTVPQLDWTEAVYERPYTLRLNGLSLTAPDGTAIVEVATAEIKLAEIPNTRDPIAIERVLLADGTVRLIADGNGGYVGLTPFVKPSDAPDPEPEPDDGPRPDLTEILDLRRLEIRDIDLVYEDGRADEPMSIPGFGLALDLQPVYDAPAVAGVDVSPTAETAGNNGAPSGPGWYQMAFNAGREPGLELAVNGRFNVNSYQAWIEDTTADITVDESTMSSLPGRVQSLLKQYEVRGQIGLVASASIDPMDFGSSDVKASVDASGVNVALGEYRFPLDHFTSSMQVTEGSAFVRNFVIEAVGGTLTAYAEYPLGGSGGVTVEWDIEKFDLQRFLASKSESGPPKIAGLFTMMGKATADASDPMQTLSGNGTFHLEDGRLMALPIVSQLANTLAVFDQLKGATTLNHRADGTFTLHPERAELSETTIVTTAFAAKVRGPIGFDQSLDLRVNAGPFRRAQQLLGDTIGNIFNKLTPDLVTYRVRGTLGEPKISVAPLGGG